MLFCLYLKLSFPSLFFCSVFSPRIAANMWFHLSSSEIRVQKNRLMVISLSLPFPLLSPHRGRAWWRDLYILLKFQIPLPEKKEREKKSADVGCSPHLHKNVGLKKKEKKEKTISERHKEKEQLKAETLDFLLEFLNTEAPYYWTISV